MFVDVVSYRMCLCVLLWWKTQEIELPNKPCAIFVIFCRTKQSSQYCGYLEWLQWLHYVSLSKMCSAFFGWGLFHAIVCNMWLVGKHRQCDVLIRFQAIMDYDSRKCFTMTENTSWRGSKLNWFFFFFSSFQKTRIISSCLNV